MNTPSRADVLLHCGEMTKNELNAAMSALMWRQEFIESQQSTIDAQRAEIERLTKERDDAIDIAKKLLRWKGEIDSHRIALALDFPDDYDNSPMYAVETLINAKIKDAAKRFEGCVAISKDLHWEISALLDRLLQKYYDSDWTYAESQSHAKFLTANEVRK